MDDTTEFNQFDASEAMKDIRGSKVPWLLTALAVTGGAAGVYWLRGQLELTERELATARASLASVQKTNGELEQKNGDLEKRVGELSAVVTSKEEEISKLKGTYELLEEQMKKEISSGDIHLTSEGGRLQVDLVDKILFDSGDAKISKRGEEVLLRIGQILATASDKQIQVSGHTDGMPISDKLTAQFPTNWELSVARATNVVRYLQEQAKVPEKQLVASGYGPYHPVASNGTPQGRARNRRIEILLTPQIVLKKKV